MDIVTGVGITALGVATYLGVRSRFFDEFLGSAAAAGLDQVVLLATGLDTRAFRLDWQPGTTVYELDVPKVLQFKNRVLTEQRAQPSCQRRTVAVDLREDWPAAVSTARRSKSRSGTGGH
jgi:methyltransferase (TIGR00027 family)